jgi:aspartyl-tRNA(Asn)/glutamyl-tRNA(Gln) amidotransferase subunit C
LTLPTVNPVRRSVHGYDFSGQCFEKVFRLPMSEAECYNFPVNIPANEMGVTMKLSRDEVLHIARLARVALTEEEINRLSEQLSNLLENFKILQNVDTTGVPPTAQSVDLQSVMRQDTVESSLTQEDVLANAPHREADCFKVRAVLE